MIKLTIEFRENEAGSTTAKGYITPSHTGTPKEMEMAMWYMKQFEKTMTDSGATVQAKKDNSRN